MAADKGAIAQCLVDIAVPNGEERNDDIGDFFGEVLWDCLRDGQCLC